MRLTIVGSGYVGLVTGTCLANTGNQVVSLDLDAARVDQLRGGGCPIYEPGLTELLQRNIAAQRLSFTTDAAEAYRDAEVIFICVGTPTADDGSSDLTAVHAVADDIADAIASMTTAPRPLVVVKSTVPVGTTHAVADRIKARTDVPFSIADNPEFLKEGDAINDFQKPDRVVCGIEDAHGQTLLEALYRPYVRQGNPCLFMDVRSAEMVKYAANAMLACRISFMNEMARLCDHHGADVAEVRRGMSTDARIGKDFLYPGLGYGGSCFPKDTLAVMDMGHKAGLPTLLNTAVHEVNQAQRDWFLQLLHAQLGDDLSGMHIGVWGLAFKPRTDDIREAPSRTIINALLASGASVAGFDPVASDNFARLKTDMTLAPDMYEAARNADALVICTEWSEFRTPDFQRLRDVM
ncbi:MAG: UDP-glucose/GDP-mannose dehydrogenase family protein, partial [Phycisphaerales bacterium]|nr:UDP-glucose/GDP-mannose dehydrogenase family protein [Phycisphaerales bacterium]